MKKRSYVEGRSKRVNRMLKRVSVTAGIVSLALLSTACLTNNGDKTLRLSNNNLKRTERTIQSNKMHTEKTVYKSIKNVKTTAGIATILEAANNKYKAVYIEEQEKQAEEEKQEKEATISKETRQNNMVKIRCTGYSDYGVTKSGEITRHGVVAGKKEWLGKTCKLYSVDENGNPGDVIGTYEFLDTGYGINGSLINGTSIDVWHSTEEAVWNWVRTYGDYVYMEMSSNNTVS